MGRQRLLKKVVRKKEESKKERKEFRQKPLDIKVEQTLKVLVGLNINERALSKSGKQRKVNHFNAHFL